ncbi:MAG: hypothetical protein CM1200mP18_17110 [Gammaproteobacteria bacterium]|nr:MAG: hypothetical protein CM1200mP18_17110 [Gammaproteobacteria bacterium]
MSDRDSICVINRAMELIALPLPRATPACCALPYTVSVNEEKHVALSPVFRRVQALEQNPATFKSFRFDQCSG